MFILLLVVAAGAGCFSQPAPPSSFVSGLEVLHYEADLTVDVEALAISGRASITLVRESHLSEIEFGLNGPGVDSVRVNGRRIRHRSRGAAGFSVDVPPQEPDTLTVDVHYRGSPREGLYRGEYSGASIVYTDGWPHRVAGWLPGIHHPAHPATLDLTIRTDPQHVVAASGSLYDASDGVMRWRLTAPAPTYTFAFAIGPYERIEVAGSHFSVAHYMLPRDTTAALDLARADSAIAYFSDMIGPYAYGTFSTVQVPFNFAGMENASAAFLASNLYGTASLEEVMVHEVAHQWFGNTVTISDWRHLWLSEGITTYLTTLFYEDVDGADAAREMRADFAAVSEGDEYSDRALVPRRIDSPYDMLTWLVYRKGASVMHLLRLAMGDEAFFAAIKDAYASAPEPVVTESLLQHFSTRSDRPLDELIAYWIFESNLPRLITRWDPNSQMLSWTITGDRGTLSGIPFQLEIGTGDDVWYVDAREEAVEVNAPRRPTVRPVGIMMFVEEGDAG